MSGFLAKPFQDSVLTSIRAYFDACHEFGNAASAFTIVTDRLWQFSQSYRPLTGFQADMPYFCLRVPTGGGKTWLAASSVALVNSQLLRSEYSVILWLVPSDAIRTQTLNALKDRDHPYHAALRTAGAVSVIDLDEAKSISRATMDTSTVVIVSTVQAFRRERTDALKVYESNGALQHHFDNLSPVQRANLLRHESDGTAPYSLANVLRLRRPFLIVDEAHNARTDISFDTFARFNPSGIMELTATPDLEKVPSNVLHSVGAAELKLAQMIKLPVVLEAESDWQVCLADAIARRDELQKLADDERRRGANYLRPLVLIQAEPHRQGLDTLDVDRVRQELINNHRVPSEEIVIATGEQRGLDAIADQFRLGIADPACPVKFVITQKALAEGWDCPFAYILVSLAAQHSSTAVEQLLGRVLRQPDAAARVAVPLNQSYAFVRSGDFARTASELRDQLVASAGFNRMDASEFVVAAKPNQRPLDFSAHLARSVMTPVVVALPEKPELKVVPASIRSKFTWDSKAKTLTLSEPIAESETVLLQAAFTGEVTRELVASAALASRTTAIEHFVTPAECGQRLRVPQLALVIQGDLQFFDDPEVLDYPWELSRFDAVPTRADLEALDAASKVAEGGELDIDESGKVSFRFLPNLQRDLGLSYQPEHWDEVRLAAWLCRNIPDAFATHASKRTFVMAWLSQLLTVPEYSLARANQAKFKLRELLMQSIRRLRMQELGNAFQQALFGDGREQRVAVDARCVFEFYPSAYAPSRDYDPRNSRFGGFAFRKHFYGRIGDFDSGEEYECAIKLDMLAQQGRIKHWVRNLVRKEGCSFFLQNATDRFYPDFICELPDGRILAVEYKGGNAWVGAQDDRKIGDLWAVLSNGQCLFLMLKDREWERIEALVK